MHYAVAEIVYVSVENHTKNVLSEWIVKGYALRTSAPELKEIYL